MNGHTNGTNGDASETGALTGTMRVKAGLAQMLKGGVIMGEKTGSLIRVRIEAAPGSVFMYIASKPCFGRAEKPLLKIPCCFLCGSLDLQAAVHTIVAGAMLPSWGAYSLHSGR